jgi:hypothetical protein
MMMMMMMMAQEVLPSIKQFRTKVWVFKHAGSKKKKA